MNKKIHVSIVGTSSVLQSHLKAFRKNSNVNIVSIYSKNFSRAKLFADRFGIIPNHSLEEIYNDKTIDAVDIITEPKEHAMIALEALKHGKHALIEKPLDIETKTAKGLLDESIKKSLKASVISQKRFDPDIIQIKKKLDNLAIGQAYLAEAKVLWKRTIDYYKHGSGWRGEYGSVLLNQAIHWLDIAIWFFGAPVEIKSITTKVKQNINCNDTAICSIMFPNNLLFNLICSTAVPQSYPEEFKIYGTDGVLVYLNEKQSRFYSIISSLRNRIHPFYKTPLQRQINDFIDSIISNREPKVTISSAYKALKLVEACEKGYSK